MSKYKGLFTFDEDNHRYVPIAQADVIIDTMDYESDSEPLIIDEKIRKAVRAWAELCGVDKCHFEHNAGSFASRWYGISLPTSNYGEDIESGVYTIIELCGEETPEPKEPTFIDLDERTKEKGGKNE